MNTTGTASFILAGVVAIATIITASEEPIIDMAMPAPTVQAASLQPAAITQDQQKAFSRAYQKTESDLDAGVLCPSCIPPCPPICP